MLTKKQIAANQKRSIKTLIERIEKLENGFEDVDQVMVEEAILIKEAAENYMDKLDEILNDDDFVIGSEEWKEHVEQKKRQNLGLT